MYFIFVRFKQVPVISFGVIPLYGSQPFNCVSRVQTGVDVCLCLPLCADCRSATQKDRLIASKKSVLPYLRSTRSVKQPSNGHVQVRTSAGFRTSIVQGAPVIWTDCIEPRRSSA